MTDNNKDFKEYLKNEMQKDSGKLPPSLSPENITNLVKGTAQTKKKGIAKKVVAIAASFAIVFVAAIVGIKLYKPPIKTIAPVSQTDSKVYTSDYAEIKSFFKSLKDSMKYESFSESIRVKSFNLGAAKYYVEDFAVNESSSASTGSAQSTAPDGMGSSVEGSSFSQTELQVEGVDEADIIKNDGKYLYVINRSSNRKLSIIDPTNPADIKILCEIELKPQDGYEFFAQEMFLLGDKLVVITNNYCTDDSPICKKLYSNDCYMMGSGGNRIGALVYDISNRSKPTLENSYSLDGSYVTSRVTDNRLVLISNYYVPIYDDNKDLEEACIPSYWVNGEKNSVPAEKINIIKGNEDDTYTLVMQLDLDSGKEPETAAILGGTSDIYCNRTDLYLARYEYKDSDDYYSVYVALGQVEEPGEITDGPNATGINENNGSDTQTETVNGPAEGNRGSAIYYIIAVAVCALALAAVAVIIRRSRKD